MFWSCCGWGRRKQRRDSEQEPDETTRLLATSDALFPQTHEAPRPPDDEALLEYKKRIERILEETAEKLVSVSVNAGSNGTLLQQQHSHIRSNSSSTASTSTAKASTKTSTDHGGSGSVKGGDGAAVTEGDTGTGRETLWRAEGPSNTAAATTKGSVYSMKKVGASSSSGKKTSPSSTKKSTKAKGKQVAREIAGLPNGHVEEDVIEEDESQEHDRDGTTASYRTANESDEDDLESDSADEGSEDESGDNNDGDEDHDEGAGNDDGSESSSQDQHRSSRPKRPRPVQEIFQSDTLTKIKPQERLEKALNMSDDDFARQLTQQ